MVRLTNPQNIPIIQELIDEFGTHPILDQQNFDFPIIFIDESHPRFEWFTSPDAPFASNTLFPGWISINQRLCTELRLDIREQFAMLFHELGHILDHTPRIGNGFQRELNADQFAVDFGLSEDLATGLTKLVESGRYQETSGDMNRRIALLWQ